MKLRKTGKRLNRAVAIILAALMMPAVPGGNSIAEEGYSHEDWTAVEALPTESGSYYLTKDIEITSAWTIRTGVTIDLCLNNHSITMTADNKAVISISGGTLSLYDCGTTAHSYTTDTWPAAIGSGSGSFTGGYITHASGMKGQGVLMTSGVFNLHGGTIIGNQTVGNGANDLYGNGGGIRAEGGTVNMTGGAVVGNKSHFGGAALLQDYAHMNLSGGRIADNQGGYAGALYLAGGTCTMTGGMIENNHSDRSHGGGIFIHKGHDNKLSRLIMSGGVIRNNESCNGGGGVYVNYGSFAMSDNAEISGNRAAKVGGGVYTWGSFDMSGGEISGNTASTTGGLHAASGSAVVMTGGRITDNTGTDEVGGLCNNGGTITLSGGVITGNSAPESGGGVYNDGTFNISGNPVITGNTGARETKSNVYLYNIGQDSHMTVIGALTGAKVGVKSAKDPVAGTPVKIAEDYGRYHTAAPTTVFFELDDSETYDVIRMKDPSDSNVYLAAKVTLTYDGNGADTGEVPAARTVIHGTVVTVADAGTLKKKGSIFDHWTTTPEGSRNIYVPGDRITLENNQTVYASWTAGYTVTWLNGDDTVLDRKEYREDETRPDTDKIPVKAEDDENTYVFDKWEENIDTDGNTVYRPEFRTVPKVKATPTATPTATPEATPTASPKAVPAAAPGNAAATPTATPTVTPTVIPTATATVAPAAAPTVSPTAAPTAGPTANPKPVPKTGDRENIFVWACLITLCAGIRAMILVLIPSGKRRK